MIRKKTLAGIMTKTLAGVTAAVILSAMTAGLVCAAAGDEIVHLDFDDGTVCGFETYIEGGACELRNEDSMLAVDITSCGSLDYANQAYWDGFSLVQGVTYQYSFDISCSIDRQVEYRLQLNGGDYHAYLGDRIHVSPEQTHVSVDWTMTEESDPAPRLCFNMGYQDDMTQDPGPHTVWIDQISLTVLDDSGAAADSGEGGSEAGSSAGSLIAVNQVGYRSSDAKTAFICCGDAAVSELCVVDESGSSVLELTAEEPFYEEAAGSRMQRADFSALTQPGTWQIRAVADGEEIFSAPFEIDEDRYDVILKSSLQMLSLQRCGTQNSLPDSADAAPFLHGVCHNTPALIYGTDQTKDVSGGWHDAGDYGRYVVPGAKAAADLMMCFEQFGLESDELGLLESGNGVPDVLDEARWELDWMLKMQDEESGGVYHKVTCRSFPGEVKPEEETDELVICPVSVTASLDFAAVMAKASVLYASYDPDFAKTALEAAHKAWLYGSQNPVGEGFHNPPEISTGEYPDTDTSDELLWAATELYLAGLLAEGGEASGSELTGEAEVASGLNSFGAHGLGWQCVSDYALIDLAWSAGHAADGDAFSQLKAYGEQAQSYPTQYCSQLPAQAGSDGFYLTLGQDFPWGSNMSVANHAVILAVTARLAGEDSFARSAKQNLDYLLGANPTGYCYVTGWGTTAPVHPHHRPSQAADSAMPGMLVGGPNSHLEDPYAQNVLSGLAPALCYADNEQSYSTNEVAVYWNSPLIALLADMEQN